MSAGNSFEVIRRWLNGPCLMVRDGREFTLQRRLRTVRQSIEEYYAQEENIRPWLELFNPPNFLDYSG